MKRLILIQFIVCFSALLNAQSAFITTWKTDNPGPSDDYTIVIPLAPDSDYDFTVDWGDGNMEVFTGVGASLLVNHTYDVIGNYTVAIVGEFPRIFFNNIGDKLKILSVNQWGNVVWESFESAFRGCENLQVLAVDSPNLSIATSLKKMFSGASTFNQPINFWDVSNITNLESMFSFASSFNQSLATWDVSNVTNMCGLFLYAQSFNQPLNSWDVSNVTEMQQLFSGASQFNQPLNSWDVSNVVNMSHLFHYALMFNQDIGNWNVSSVTNMSSLFEGASSFNEPLNAWDVSNVTKMRDMFHNATTFNQPLEDWNVSNVTLFALMFEGASAFNYPIDSWDVSNVSITEYGGLTQMFAYASSFNQPLNSWDVSNVTNMRNMFREATSFNQPLDSWDVSNVENMQRMFEGATAFNQSLGNWDLSSCWNFTQMLDNCGMSYCNYDATLQGWAAQELNNWQTLGANGLEYTAIGAIARQDIIANDEWVITGDVLVVPVPLEVNAIINGPEITIVASAGGGNYAYDWSGPNGFTSNESSIVAPQNGLYAVIVTDGCETWSDTFEVLTVQITETEKTNIQIFPNPSNGLVQVVSPTAQHLTLYDQSGRRILETNINTGNQQLDLSSLLPGVYSGRLMSLNGDYLQTVRIALVR